MSHVFVAEDILLGRSVVIKVLSRSLAAEISNDRFAREIRVASQLQHPNIVPVFSAGVAAGLPYYTMPYVGGQSLRKAMIDSTIRGDDAVGILIDVARALAFAHEHGVVHRDIKPENILLSGGVAVVTDFGIAKAVAQSTTGVRSQALTGAGSTIGTPAYMSPEQASGDKIDATSDVYSWGVVAYELLAGRHPFADRATSASLIRAQISEKPTSLDRIKPDVPPEMATLVTQALEKDPAQRPASGRELCSQLTHATAAHRVLKRRWSLKATASVAMAAVALAVVLIATQRNANHAADPSVQLSDSVRSLAVLPFVNVGGDSKEEYFSDGVSDEIADALARVPGIRLVSRTSSFAFKGRADLGASEIGRRLNVSSLLEGQVRRANNRLRISSQLTDTETGLVLWHNLYERNAKDIFTVQEDIARSITSALQAKLAIGQKLGASTANLAAHDLYLRARFEHDKYNEVSLRAAIALYDSALMLDSNYVDAYTGVASAWIKLSDDWVAPRVALPNAVAALNRALGLDSSNTLAQVELLHADWSKPRAYLLDRAERVIALSPKDPETLDLAGGIIFAYDVPRTIAIFRNAVALDPLHRQATANLSFALSANGNPEEALALVRRKEKADSLYLGFHFAAAEALIAMGRLREALSEHPRNPGLADVALGQMARAYAGLGRRDSALALINKLKKELTSRYVSKDFIAMGYAALGMQDDAMNWLEQAERDRSFYLRYLASAPAWKPLQGNPRFEAMLRRLDLKRP